MVKTHSGYITECLEFFLIIIINLQSIGNTAHGTFDELLLGQVQVATENQVGHCAEAFVCSITKQCPLSLNLTEMMYLHIYNTSSLGSNHDNFI